MRHLFRAGVLPDRRVARPPRAAQPPTREGAAGPRGYRGAESGEGQGAWGAGLYRF